MLKAIVFDFDGVIVDSEPLHYRAFLRTAKELNLQFDYQTYLDEYIGFDDRDAFRSMLRLPVAVTGSAAQEARIADLIEKKALAFEAVVEEGIETIAGIESLIRAAADAVGLPIAIASGATRRDIDLILRRLGLEKVFSDIITADLVTHSKPDPETYAMAVEHLARRHPSMKLQPADCLAIEDTVAGIESARSAGLQTLALLTSTPADKLHRAHRVMTRPGGPTLEELRTWYG